MRQLTIQRMVIAGLLIAVGIAIPMFAPSLPLPPASFTLASHVAIFIAMTISPGVAVAVTVGTTAGFFLRGLHIVIVLRAASHLLFALLGACYLQKDKTLLHRPVASRVFSLVIAVIHAAAEAVVATVFYFGGGLGDAYYQQGFLYSVLLLVGVGGAIHSMVDFEISRVLVFALEKQKNYAIMTGKAPQQKV